MRSHETIIKDAGGATALANKLGFDDPGLVHQWKRNSSIPAGHWKAIVDAGLASLEELAEDAATRARTGERKPANADGAEAA